MKTRRNGMSLTSILLTIFAGTGVTILLVFTIAHIVKKMVLKELKHD